MMSFESSSIYTDAFTGNQFRIEQAQGLPEGERALIFHWSKEYGNCIPLNRAIPLCSYYDINKMDFHTESSFIYTGDRAEAFALSFDGDKIGIPRNYTVADEYNLGLFANAALGPGYDPHRINFNSQIVIKEKLGKVLLYTRGRGYDGYLVSGQEVLLSYGQAYDDELREMLERKRLDEHL